MRYFKAVFRYPVEICYRARAEYRFLKSYNKIFFFSVYQEFGHIIVNAIKIVSKSIVDEDGSHRERIQVVLIVSQINARWKSIQNDS